MILFQKKRVFKVCNRKIVIDQNVQMFLKRKIESKMCVNN